MCADPYRTTSKNNNNNDDNTMKENDTTPRLPFYAQFWLNFYRAVPKVNLLFGHDIGFMLVCVVMLCVVRSIAYQILLSFGWPDDDTVTREAAACAAGSFHTVNLVPVLAVCLWRVSYLPSKRMKDYPVWWQDLVDAMLQLCSAHMIHDGIFGVLALRYQPDTNSFALTDMDPIYLGHHVVTLVFMMSNRLAGVGQTAAITCMYLGELTNPTYNANTIAELGKPLECCHGPLALQIGKVVKALNAALFVPARGFLCPFFAVWITVSFFFTKAGGRIPILLRLVWTILMWGIVLGGLPFVPDQVDIVVDFFTEMGTAATPEL